MAKGLGPIGSIGGRGATAIASIPRGGIPSLGAKGSISLNGAERAGSNSSFQARAFDTPRSADLRSFLKNSVAITRSDQIGFKSSPKPGIESVKSNIPFKINIPVRKKNQAMSPIVVDQSRGEIISFNPEFANTKPALTPDTVQPAQTRPNIEIKPSVGKPPEAKGRILLEEQVFLIRDLALARAIRAQQRMDANPEDSSLDQSEATEDKIKDFVAKHAAVKEGGGKTARKEEVEKIVKPPDELAPIIDPEKALAKTSADVNPAARVIFPQPAEFRPVPGSIPSPMEYQRLAIRIRTVQRLMLARQAKVFASPEVSAFAQVKTAAQPKAESAPRIKQAVGIKISQADRTKILTGLRRVSGEVGKNTAQSGQAESAMIQKAHDINRNRINALDAAFVKVEKERGAVERDELIKESGFLGKIDESPLIQQLGLNKKDGSKPRIIKALDPIRVKRSEIAGIVLKNTAVRLGDKDATEPATHTEIRNVLTLPDVADTLTDYERVLRRVLIRELKQEAVTEDTNIQAQTADKIEDQNIREEKIIPDKIVIFPGLSPFTEAGLLATLDNPLDNIGVIERRQLFLAA